MRLWLPFLGEAGDEQYRQLYGLKTDAYILMTNHVHLLIDSARVPLCRIMQGLHWCTWDGVGESVRELGKRLHRDPTVISRLYSAYAAARDEKKEAALLHQLRQ